MRFVIFWFLSFWVQASVAQDNDFSLELTQKLIKAYYTPYPQTYTFDMHQYDSSGKVFIENMKGEIAASTKFYHMSYGNIEVIVEDTFMLTRNSEVREILLKSIRISQRDSLLALSINAIIARLKDQQVKVKKLKTTENTTTYELSFDYLEEAVYVMTIQNKTGYIEQLDVIYYAENDRFHITPYKMKIYYSNYRPTKQYSPLKSYFNIENKKMILTEKYKDFKVYRF